MVLWGHDSGGMKARYWVEVLFEEKSNHSSCLCALGEKCEHLRVQGQE